MPGGRGPPPVRGVPGPGSGGVWGVNLIHPRQASPVDFRFRLEAPSVVAITIHDRQGHVVRHVLAEPRGVGDHVVVWDGTNDAGRPVASGTYQARIQMGDRVFTRRLVVVR